MESILDDFDLVCVLGEGGFGKVYLVRGKDENPEFKGIQFALKAISRQKIDEYDMVPYVEQEIGIQSKSQHPNIVRCFDFFYDTNNVYMVLEHMERSLLEELKQQKHKFLSEKRTAAVMHSLAKALEFLHKNGIIHRDVKPENVLLDNNGTAKLSDFGVATRTLGTRRRTICGSINYMAPEIQRQSYNQSVDLWSMGVVCHELLTGEVSSGVRVSARIPMQARRFIMSLLQMNPERRMSAADAKRHPWILLKREQIRK